MSSSEGVILCSLKAGADVNHNALMTAVANGQYWCVKLIIEENYCQPE